MLTFDQFRQMEQAMFNAVSLIPHVDNGRAKASGPNADAVFNSKIQGLGMHGVREVHHDPSRKVTTTFNYVFAAPLQNPHFT